MFYKLWGLILLLSCYPALAQNEIIAEVVWTSYLDEQHHIHLSFYRNGEWSKPQRIYSSKNPLTTPTIGSNRVRKKIVLWTEQFRSKALLMSMRGQVGIKQTEEDISSPAPTSQVLYTWSKTVLFSDYGSENFAPSIVFDSEDEPWVFWSASKTGLSDIFVVRSTENGWTKPLQVNELNDVPDSTPIASNDDDGNVVVEWNTYDFEIDSYRLESQAFLVENLEPEEFVDRDAEVSLDKIQLPDFLPYDRRVVLHFPGNKQLQSVELNK